MIAGGLVGIGTENGGIVGPVDLENEVGAERRIIQGHGMMKEGGRGGEESGEGGRGRMVIEIKERMAEIDGKERVKGTEGRKVGTERRRRSASGTAEEERRGEKEETSGSVGERTRRGDGSWKSVV